MTRRPPGPRLKGSEASARRESPTRPGRGVRRDLRQLGLNLAREPPRAAGRAAMPPGVRLPVAKLAGIGLGVGGILLIFRGQIATAGADKAFPMIAIVLSATCAAVATVALKRWGAETDPVTFNAGAMAVGAASLAALSVTARETWRGPSWPEGIGAILFLAL